MGKYTPWVGAPVGVLKHAYWEEEVRDTDLLFPQEALEAPVKGAQEAARLFSSLAKEEFRLPPQAELYEGTLRVPASLEPWLEVLEALGVSEGALYRRADRVAALPQILHLPLEQVEEALVASGKTLTPEAIESFFRAVQAALEEKGPLQGWGLVTPTGERLLWWGRRGE